jgi:hypothetical protein
MKKQGETAMLLKKGKVLQAKDLWPALKGSLAKVHKPCIRKNCPLCERGEKHPAWILTVSQKGQRRCLYVPEGLVPVIQLGIENGRKIEEWLSDQGPEIVKAFRLQRDGAERKKKKTVKS